MSIRKSLYGNYAAQSLNFFLNFGTAIVVARIVSPKDFGIFAMAGAISIIINVFMQFGLAKYIVREETLGNDILRSLFTVNVLMSMLYTFVLIVAAIAYEILFPTTPQVAHFLFVFSFFPLIAMFEFIPSALCAREMRFGLISLLSVARALTTAVTTIGLAYLGFAYMSFAWASIAAWLVSAVGFNLALWRPDLIRLRFEKFREIVSFGTQIIGVSGASQLSTRSSEMYLGAYLGLTSLGFYSRASSLPFNLHNFIFASTSNVVFSKLSAEQRVGKDVISTYSHFMRMILGLLWPMLIGLALLSQPTIYILYGEKWLLAALPLSLLAIAMSITLGLGHTSELFILRHRTSQQVKLESVRAIVGFLLFAGGTALGLVFAAAARVVEAVFAYLLYRRPLKEILGDDDHAMRRVYIEGLGLTAAATLPSLLLMIWSDWSPRTPIAYIASAVGAGVLLWAVVLIVIRHPLYAEAMRLLKRQAKDQQA